MKKFTVIFLSMLLVLMVGQTTLAKGFVALDLGYYGQLTATSNVYFTMVFKLGLSGEYNFNDEISLSGSLSLNPPISQSTVRSVIEFDLDAKFNMFNNEFLTLGLNTGLMYQNSSHSDGLYNDLFFNIGAHGEFSLSPKIKLYGEISLPVINLRLISSDIATETHFIATFGTYNNTYFTTKIGMRYQISSKIFLGVDYYIFRNFPAITNKFNLNVGYSF